MVREPGMQDGEAREAAFRAEVAAFQLRFRCAACAHVAVGAESGQLGCSLRYPNEELIGALRAFGRRGDSTVCKYFELGESELEDPNSGWV